MGTEDGPLPELEIVPDAAIPEPESLAVDIVVGTALPRPPAVPSLAEIEAERRRAVEAAGRHLDRTARRAARRAVAAGNAWASSELGAARYCVIDLETTGTGVWGEDEILEVGAVRLAGGDLGREFATLVRPRGRISPSAQRIHGITAEMVGEAPLLEAVLPHLQEMLRDCVLVFHNAPFDLGFLQRAFAGAGREPLCNPVVDTLVIARQLLGGKCGLGHLGGRLGLPAPHLHRALADARLTAQLLLVQLECLQTAGARRLGDIPGILSRPPRPRRARGPATDLVADTLRVAAAAGQEVQLVYRLGPGLAPQEICVVPLEVHGPTCLVRPSDRGTPVLLALERIEALRPRR